jgi:aryl-alcohol dehydrogenase-like predicted oxidoreductase
VAVEQQGMEQRPLGRTGRAVGVVGLGTWQLGADWGQVSERDAVEVLDAAPDAGINFLDTADIYGGTKSEEYIGRALGSRRSEVVIATKLGGKIDDERKGAKPDYIRRAAEDSLRRLQTDRIDLYQLHMPDPEVPIEATLAALRELVRAGKVREIGCSNFTVEQLRAAEAAAPAAGVRFVSVQNHYSLLHRDAERDVLPECERLKIAFLPYFPLANGLLTGKYRKGQPPPEGSRLAGGSHSARSLSEENLSRVEALIQFAESRGHTILELAVSWLLTRPAVASVIAGATRPEQVRANAAAAGWRLTREDLAQIDAIVPPPS